MSTLAAAADPVGIAPAPTAAVAFTVPPASSMHRLHDGFQFIEGPGWEPTTRTWVFSDIPADKIYRIQADGSVTVAVSPSGKANGTWIDSDGTRYTCHHWTRDVTRTPASSTVATVVASAYHGHKFNSPNDCCVFKGALWFTDPVWGLEGRPAEMAERGVYRLDPGATEPVLVISGMEQPNGICFSPDGTTLYVGESGKAHQVHAWTMHGGDIAPGQPPLGRVFTVISPGVPDGMRCDRDGRLYVGSGDGVQIFTPEGTKLGTLPTPKAATNCAFGGADGRTLLITAGDAVWSVEVPVPGLH